MSNNEAGAFLNITPDVLKKLDSFDEKLEKIEKHAHTAADALKNGFGSVVVDTSKLENAITSLAKKIDAIKGNPFEGAGKGAEETTRKTTSLNESLSRAADLLNRIGNNKIGEGSFANFNISGLKQGYSDLKKYIENMDLSKPQQKAAVEAMRYMKMELDEQRKTDEQRAQSKEKETERRIAADRRAYKASADLAKAQNYKQNTTAQGALDFSKTANTLQRQITAIEYLKKARLSLNTTDANYKSTLEQINQAIAKHNQALTDAGIKSQQLATRHRNLMNTAGQLSRQLALVFSVSQIEGYISKLANVRGEFELQQRSLEAILQNKAQADQIFNKTVQLAVKSPFQIKELVTFTKQLAAYRIESDKLYDTTKRLADVSAGLGVDMGRLILAYGQVKAAAYLRGTEVRQFTEAGINMYGELQKLFKTRDQADYTTAQIVDMISKRKVTFEDVEQVFENLTSKEGIFYNMQEIQAETLQGKISNLKDSIDVMLNSIGKANEDTLKGAIDAAKVLLDNWENVVSIGNALVGVFALLYMHSLRTGVAMKAVFSTNMAANATKTLKTTELLANGFKSLSLAVRTFSANLKAAFVTNLPALGIIAVITAVSDAFTRLQNKSEAILDIFKEMGDKKKGLYQISDAYKQIISASSNAKDAEISDTKEVIDKKREQINKLVELYNKNGLKIDIQLKDIPQSEIDEYFSKLYNGYANFIRLQESLKIALAENNGRIEGWFGVFGENIETDSKQLTNAYNNVIENTRDLGNAISLLINYYDNLSESQKKQYEQQYKELIDASTRNDGESEIAYLERQSKAISDFSKSIGATLDKSVIKAREYSKQFRIALTGAKGTGGYKEYLREFDNELDDILERVKSRYSEKEWDINGKVYLESILDTELASQGWEQWKLDHAKERWEIKPKIDEKETDNELNGLDKIFKKWFSSHTYKLGIEYEDLGDKNAFKGFLEEGDAKAVAYKKAKESAERLKNAMDSVFNQKQSGLTEEQWKNAFGIAETVDKESLIEYYEELAKANKTMAESAGWRETQKGSKAERDIWAERISVLKEMQSRYEKLNQLMGENAAIEQTLSAFKPALEFTGMDKMNILPTKEGMIKAYEELLKNVTDSKKITELKKIIAELKIEIQQDDLKEQLEKTKKNIEDMFNGLDLHKKLKDAGLSEAEVQQLFPGLAKTLDDVQKGIEAEYQKKYPKGEYLIADTDANKQYLADLNKLNQQRIKDSQDLVIELTKNYKSQLTDRLQLDRWYYEERAKIQRAKLTDEQKTLYESNLTSQYNKKSDENTWKQFQNSDMYISMFENIEGASTRMLTAMRDKLMSLRENLKDLPADQLKAIINQQEKIDEMIAKKNPFIGLTSGVKEYIQFLKERKELEEENIRANNAVDYYTSLSNEQSKIVEQKRQEYNAAVATSGILSKEARQLSVQLETEKSKLDIILKQLTAEKKISKETAEQIRNGQNLGDTLKNKIGESGRIFSEFSSALPQIASDLENVFGSMSDGTKDVINRTAEAAGGIAQIATGIAQGPVGYLQAAMGLAKTVSALFGSDDARLQKEIEGHERKIKKLEREYDKLKESIDNVWDITKLQEYGNELDENINKQIVSLNAMIAAERDKKDTDWDKINEWQEQIEDLRDTLADSANDMIAELGGVGSDENFKTLAENFASAWLEAFQETGDGLSGLQDSFDDFMENYVKQQILLRLSDKFFGKMFEEFDEIIATKTPMEQEDQERYFELQAQITRLRNTANNSVIKSVAKKANAAADEIENSEEYKKLQEAWTDFLKPNDINTEAIKDWSDRMQGVFGEYNEAAEEIFNQIGWEPGGKANLSALQQGIQGITETTAEALEALLNSIRFFVNQQTTDITAIRNLLDARYSLESQAETNPMLIELKAQTGYLEIISDRIDRVFAPNSNSRGAGLRVFISD